MIALSSRCLCLLAGATFFLPWEAEAREWQLQDGETIEADFFFRDEAETWFKDQSGKLYVIQSSRLERKDLDFIERIENYLSGGETEAWPRQVLPRGGFRLTGGPETYRSSNFQIFAANAK